MQKMDDTIFSSFKPSLLIRHPMTQSAMASLSLGAAKQNPVLLNKVSETIDTGTINTGQLTERVYLSGEWSMQQNPKGLLILLHGWEGSSDSSYVLRTARKLYIEGCDIFRLNYRDHSETFRLNRGLFNGSLLTEVHRAVCLVAKTWVKDPVRKNLPVYLAGFSLGGNYTLRLTYLHNTTKEKIANLKHSFAVSPALDPHDATEQMDNHPVLGRYFLKKWSQSLLKKQQAHPALYDFTKMLDAPSVMELTERVVRKYSQFQDAKEYFKSYTISHDHISPVKTGLTILTAADDPIITVDHFYDLIQSGLPQNTRLWITDYGGHNGFYYNTQMHCLYEDLISRRLADYNAKY